MNTPSRALHLIDNVDVRRAVTRDDLFALTANGISIPSEAVNLGLLHV